MRHRAAFAVIALVLAASPGFAQLDAEAKTPCLWRIVIKAQPHPLLSTAFREQIKRDIVAALQPALGTLGMVEVIDLAELPRDKWDTLWGQFDEKGFSALDAPRDLTGVKTHFLNLEYRDGQYILESRQYDGFTGFASPVVRKQSTRASEMVGRTAGLMLDRDFGLSGTIELVSNTGDEARVIVRGGQLSSLDRFVKTGDIFAISRILKTDRPAPPPVRTATGKIIAAPAGSVPPPALTVDRRSAREMFTLLRVKEVKDGTLRCEVLTSYQNALAISGRVVGFRCTKLGTADSPLVVRLKTTNEADQKLTGQATVKASESGFAATAESQQLLFKDGLFRSPRSLSNIACVTVQLGNKAKQFPVPVLGSEPVVLEFEVNPELERKAEYLSGVRTASARAADARNAQAICFEATAKLIDKQKNVEALARARGGFQAADAADKSISDDVARLKESGYPEGAATLAAIDNQLTALRAFNGKLNEHVKRLEEVVKRENDPTIAAREVQADALVTRITVLLGQGDVEEAIGAYKQLLTLLPDNAEAKARLAQLEKEYAAKNEGHAKAREYLLKKWSAISTIPDFKDSLKDLGPAIEECKKNGDHYTLRKLLTVFAAATVKLNEMVAGLDANAEGDKKLVADAAAVIEALPKLEAGITKFLEGKKD